MAVLVVLLPGDGKDVPVGSDVAAGLAKLGITSLTLLRDRATFAVLLEGWQFDPDRSGQSAVALLTAETQDVRLLHSVLHMAVPVHPDETKDEPSTTGSREEA